MTHNFTSMELPEDLPMMDKDPFMATMPVAKIVPFKSKPMAEYPPELPVANVPPIEDEPFLGGFDEVNTMKHVHHIARHIEDVTDRQFSDIINYLWTHIETYIKQNYHLDYHKYIRSDEWKEKATRAKDAALWRCQLCNVHKSKKVLHAHHRTYKRLGAERPEDITVLCVDCHKLFHENSKIVKEYPQ